MKKEQIKFYIMKMKKIITSILFVSVLQVAFAQIKYKTNLPNSSNFVILSKQDNRLKRSFITTDDAGNPYLLYQSSLLPVFVGENIAPILLPNDLQPQSISTISSSGFYYTQGGNLYFFAATKTDTLTNFTKNDTKNLTFLEIDNDNFYLIKESLNGYFTIFLIDNNFDVHEIITTQQRITAIAGSKDVLMLAIDNCIFLLSDKKLTLLLKESSKIISLAIDYTGGIFYSTESYINYFDARLLAFPICNKGAKQLICNATELYILLTEGVVCKITNVAQLHKLNIQK